MENTCINLPSVFQQLTSLILHWSEQTELSKQRYLSFHLKAYNIEGKDICFCNLKVSTNCKLPLIDLLKDGQLDRLAQLVLDVQCGSDDNFALVCTVVDDSCHGTTVTTSTCIRLNRDNTSILNVLAKQKDGVAEEGSNLPGTHLHVKFHRNKYTLLLEGKTIYDFLYKLKFFHPNMKLSFMLSLDGQMSKASYGFQNSTWVGRFQVVSDPKYYITSAPATAKIIFGMGEKLDERNCFQVECLVCHVLGKSAMKAHGSASMYGPNQVPMIVEYEDWANVEPLTVVDWKAFGFLAYVDDAKLTGRSASVLRLSVADPTLLPPWATNHRFELRFSYVIRCLAVDVKDETDISHWMKKMCTENPSHLQTATTAALTALYCTPSDVNNEVKSELEKFLPIITESLAEMYTRSGNIDFRQTLESAFQIHNGLSLEAVMRRSLQGLLAVEKDLCGAASQTVASQPPSSTIDNWECCYMQASNVTALDSLTNIRATDVTALDHSSSEYPPLSEEDERWFTQMEQELAN